MRDTKINFVFRVLAYRELSERELRMAYALWRSQSKRNRPKANQVITIISSIE